MGNTKIRDLITDLEGYGSTPKWEVLFYSVNADGTVSLTIKDNREAYDKAYDKSIETLAEQSQEAANDNNN